MHNAHTSGAWGIDVAKTTLEVHTISGIDGARSSHTVPNSPEGWITLVSLARATLEDITVMMEATGDYHLGIAMALTNAGVAVYVTNPYVVHNYVNMSMRKTKTDKRDSEKIAELVYAHHDVQRFTIPAHFAVKKLVRVRRTFIEVRQKLTNSLRSLEDSQKMNVADLSDAIQTVKETLAHIHDTIKHIDATIRTAQPVKQALATVGKIRGVSEDSLAQIVVELGDLNRFTSQKQVVAYCGLDPSVHTSGTSIHGKSRLSKRGSPTVRGVLTKVAWGLKMHDADTKKYYQRKRAEGKHYFTCLVAIARQFLVRLYSALKSKSAFLTPTQLEENRIQQQKTMDAVCVS